MTLSNGLKLDDAISFIRTLLDGRKLAGRAIVERDGRGGHAVTAMVVEAEGQRETTLAAFDSIQDAITVQRTINFDSSWQHVFGSGWTYAVKN